MATRTSSCKGSFRKGATLQAAPGRGTQLKHALAFVSATTPLREDNGLQLRDPTPIWRDADGMWRGCACEKRATYAYVRRDLRVSWRLS